MRLLSLELKDFRNHRSARAPLDGEPTLLLGENGSGKTNWIEGAVLLSIGRSFRGARDRDLLRRGEAGFEVRGEIMGRAGVRSEIVARGVSRGPREVTVDGEALPRLGDLLGRFPTVHFSVEDVASLNGAPSGRRRFLDVALCQLEPAYVGHLRDYTAALKQRNRLLVERAEVSPDEFAAWEEILARSGAELDRRREDLTAELDRVLRELAEGLDPTLKPVLEYAGMGLAGTGEGGDGASGPGAGEEAVAHRMARLESLRFRDRRLGWTSEGPHRAAVGCKIGGCELNDGASRGMSRLYSSLLRLALARVLDARLEEPAVVFLDDPESELDPRWIGRLLALVPETSQAIVTACRPLSEMPTRYRVIDIESLGATGATATAATTAHATAG
ncbi:MAG: DNA replication/repair protein RecF, partial [Solirubrobacterales bacterium]